VNQGISLLVYPVKDIAKAKTLYRVLLGTDPYVDGVLLRWLQGRGDGDRPGRPRQEQWAHRVSLRQRHQASLKEFVEAGFVLDQDARDVGGGMLIARVKDADGNTVGLSLNPPSAD
jgi:hypothetical protein